MNKTIAKLFISLLSLIFAVLLFGTVSYAWLSISTTNVVHNLSIQLSSDNMFRISLDGINFHDKLEFEDVMKVVGTDLTLTDVTSSDGVYFFKGGPKILVPASKNKDYVSITLYFQTTYYSYGQNVYLVENVSSNAYLNDKINGTYVISKGINWLADSTFQYGEDPIKGIIQAGERTMLYAAEAVRISFIEKQIEENKNDKRKEEDLNTKIFDLSRYPNRGYGTSYGGLDYYNVKHTAMIAPPLTIQNVVNELSSFLDYNPYIPKNDNSYLIKLIETNMNDPKRGAIYQGKVEMNIWLEGWDADCFDAIFKDKISIQLKFKGARDI